MSPTQGRDTEDLGMAFFISILSAVLGRPMIPGLVVLGQMTIHGVLSRVENLADRQRVAMDAGARQVMIPTANAPDFGSIPTALFDKLRVEFFSDPAQAAFKALADL